MILFVFTLFLMVFIVTFRMKKLKDINSFNIAISLIFICFGLVPLVLNFVDIPNYYNKGWLRTFSPQYLNKGDYSTAMIYSLIGYIVYISSYKLSFFKSKEFKVLTNKQLKYLTYFGVFLLFLGVFSFLVYLKSLGSIVGGYLANNRMLFEADKVDVTSSVSFLKKFSSLIIYATYILWGLKSVNKSKLNLVLYYIGLIASVAYLFYTAGRMSLIVFMATIIITSFTLESKGSLIKTSMLGIVAIFIMLFGKSIFQIFLYDDALDRSFNRIQSGDPATIALLDFVGEFSFPIVSFIAALDIKTDWLLFKDFIFSFTYMLPAGLLPNVESTALQNTRNVLGIDRNIEGIPSDIFTYGYLNLGIVGAMITPVFFGVFCKWVDSHKRTINNPLLSILLVSISITIGFRVMYFDPKHLLKGSFSLLLTIALVYLIVRLTGKVRRE